ncbi:MAG: tRNA (N6-isopentenyl adenosine(37)-C2)-methylthiotransferase MiaB [Deltaproteobacteria bacterium]|nr:tRNA (N6-isopentenyl adenosine(37)-C2)-methylthiotransferase MiaB [Deltaproteobacteria bacterium]
MNFYIETYGCQMNERDSEEINALLRMEGHFETNSSRNADIIIINTCSVREKPSQKALSAVGRYIKSKNQGKKIVAICGCFAKQEGERLKERFPNIDLIFGPQQIKDLPILLNQVLKERRSIIDTSDTGYVNEEKFLIDKDSVTAFVNITKGCDNFCSFCIVPYLRGREFSRPKTVILEEIKKRVENGVKEITILGQNVNSYYDKHSNTDFVDLLEDIHSIEGLERIRFTTSHPKDVSNKLIMAFSYLPKLCNHIHLPVQSGSDRILSLMNRKYSRQHYIEITKKLRDIRKNISITTDIIVGFPTETDQDFEDTLSLVEEVKFDTAFSFKYSPRPMTIAYRKLRDDVPPKTKEIRLKILQGRIEEIAQEKNRNLEGKVLDVLVEEKSEKFQGQYISRTSCNRVVNIISNEELKGKIVKVKITKALKHSLLGELWKGEHHEESRSSRNIA